MFHCFKLIIILQCFNCAFVLILHCYFCSIVGNPLICVSTSIEGCSGSVTLMPVPFSQAILQGVYPSTSIPEPGSLSFLHKIVFLTRVIFSFVGKHKSKKLAIALGVSFSCVSLLVLFLGLFWYRKKRQHGAILYIGGM